MYVGNYIVPIYLLYSYTIIYRHVPYRTRTVPRIDRCGGSGGGSGSYGDGTVCGWMEGRDVT